MLTLRTIRKVMAQKRAYGENPLEPHRFGGPEPDNYPMQERIAKERQLPTTEDKESSQCS